MLTLPIAPVKVKEPRDEAVPADKVGRLVLSGVKPVTISTAEVEAASLNIYELDGTPMLKSLRAESKGQEITKFEVAVMSLIGLGITMN